MNKQIKLAVDLYLIVIVVIIVGIILNNIKISDNYLRTQGEGYSVLSSATRSSHPKHTVYGFLPFWTLNESKNIQYKNLTHIAYFALNITSDGSFENNEGYYAWKNNEDIKDIIEKSKEANVRFALTLISHDDEISSDFLNCEKCWKNLLEKLTVELDAYGITDVNVDFEYVEPIEVKMANKYTNFIDYLNTSLDSKYNDSHVVVSTFADAYKRERITVPHDLANVSDGLFVMAYDFHRPTSEFAGPVSPLGGAGTFHDYDINTMLSDYLAHVPPNKIILGVPYYGYNWVVDNNQEYARRKPGDDDIGFSKSQTYADVLEIKIDYNPKELWDEVGQSPYFTYISDTTGSIRQVYYENADSLQIKYRLAKNNGLMGVGIWALGYDGGYQELWNLLGQEFP